MSRVNRKQLVAQSFRVFRNNVIIAGIAFGSAACGAGSKQYSSLRDFREVVRDSVLNLDRYPVSNYQVGPEWGRFDINDEVMNSATPQFQRLVKATASIGGATAYYLGVHNGIHVMATNNHVIPDDGRCFMTAISFWTGGNMVGEAAHCRRLIATWKEVDFSLIEIRFKDDATAAQIAGREVTMRFDAPIEKGRELMMAGFGVAGTRGYQQYRGTHDSDCKVYSRDNEFRLMADPDQVNPGEGKVWLFALGCDISHGDSGSALAARDNGDIIGIISTGRIPKNPKVREAAYLEEIYASDSEDVWAELGYGVPASKIAEYMRKQASDPVIGSVLRAGNGL
jgi:hypothetical protein